MNSMKFSKKWFNPLFFILKQIEKNERIKTVLIYGSKSSSKTHTIAQFIALNCATKNYSAIAYRKESTQIKISLKKTFKNAIESIWLQGTYTEMEMYFKNVNGNDIKFKGLDSETKVKGVEGYSYVYFDELDHFTEDEYNQMQLSFRGEKSKIFFGAWNPVSAKSWLKKMIDKTEWNNFETEVKLPGDLSFVKISDCGSIVLIKTNYEDNYWTVGSPCGTYGYKDYGLLLKYDQLKVYDYSSWLVNVRGEWGQEKTGNRYYVQFKDECIKECSYDAEKLLYLSFDFNIVPYITCIVSQVEKTESGYLLRTFKEYCFENPKNNTIDLTKQIAKDFYNHKRPVVIYGDYSGANRTGFGMNYDGEQINNHYQIIENILQKNGLQIINNIYPNESLIERHNFVNLIFANKIGISYEVDPSCINTIDDLVHCKFDKDGKKLKKVVKSKVTGESYQERGHCSDALEYKICGIFADEFENYKKLI